jgi:hypothetical protein
MSVPQSEPVESARSDSDGDGVWAKVAALEELRRRKSLVVKTGGKQIALFSTEKASMPATTAARTKAIR